MAENVNTGVTLFTNEKFGSVRVVMRDGEPWFVASDVAKALGFANPSDAVNRHCKKSIKTPFNVIREGTSSPVHINLIPESDVYRLIMRSNTSLAEQFQDWVTEEVLPSIRKTGSYSMKPALPDFNDPVAAARAWADAVEAQRKAEAELKEFATVTGQLCEVVKTQTTKLEQQADELGYGRTWKTVTCIPWLLEYFVNNHENTCMVIGKELSKLCREMRIAKRQIPHPRYPHGVGCYHVDVIEEFKRRLDANPVLLEKWRIQ